MAGHNEGMRRRSFLGAIGAAVCIQETPAESSLGTVTWNARDGVWRRELPDGPLLRVGAGPLRPRARADRTRVFSPDRHRYATVRIHQRKPGPHGETQARADLIVAEPDGKPRVLLSNDGDIRIYGWTRDGQTILYWRAPEWSASLWADSVDLYAIPAAGGKERGLGVKTLAHGDMAGLAPKGNLLAVTRGFGRETWSDQQIAVVDLDSGAIRELTPKNMAALCPAWSPDGAAIACHAAPALAGGRDIHDNLQQRKIWLLDPNGATPPRQLTRDSRYRDEEPMWSADGSHILFGRMGAAGRPSLWLMARDGSGARHICDLFLPPPSGGEDAWFGYYGYIDWRSAFDWRR